MHLRAKIRIPKEKCRVHCISLSESSKDVQVENKPKAPDTVENSAEFFKAIDVDVENVLQNIQNSLSDLQAVNERKYALKQLIVEC